MRGEARLMQGLMWWLLDAKCDRGSTLSIDLKSSRYMIVSHYLNEKTLCTNQTWKPGVLCYRKIF